MAKQEANFNGGTNNIIILYYFYVYIHTHTQHSRPMGYIPMINGVGVVHMVDSQGAHDAQEKAKWVSSMLITKVKPLPIQHWCRFKWVFIPGAHGGLAIEVVT